MSTNISNPPNTLAKVRLTERYVSQSLNAKLNGLTPPGVVRGGRLGVNGAALCVTVEADSKFGDSIYSYINAAGEHLTFRQTGNLTLDLTPVAGTTVYVALYVDYTTTAATVVYWRTYSEAELFGGAPVAEAPYVVVLGRVVVPGGGVIPAADITPARRREGWARGSAALREWRLATPEGSFDRGRAAISPIADEPIPGWSAEDLAITGALVTAGLFDGGGRSGRCAFFALLAGAVNQTVTIPYAGLIAVEAGQFIDASVWVRCDVVVPGPGAAGVVGLRLEFYNVAGGVVATEDVSDLTLINTQPWTEVRRIMVVPTGAVSLRVWLRFDDDNASSAGSYYFDDVRVFLESGAPQDPEAVDDWGQASVRAASLEVIPPPSSVLVVDDVVDQTLQLRQVTAVAGVLQAHLRARAGATQPYLLTLDGGGLLVDRLINSLGADLIGSAANAALARITTSIPPQATAEHVLLLELPQVDVTKKPVRVYASMATPAVGSAAAIFVTINAEWQAGANNWVRDLAGDAGLIGFTSDGLYVRWFPAAGFSPWANAAWSSGAPNGETLLSLLNVAGPGTEAKLHDALIQFLSATALTNPLPATVPLPNALYSKNITKAWCLFETDGIGGITLLDGFGVLSVVLTVAGRVEITFHNAFANVNYASFVQKYVVGAVDDSWSVTSQVAGVATIELNSSVPALRDLNGFAAKASYHADGEQAS